MTDTTPDLQIGAEHILTPHDLSVSGGSVARLANMAVFLDGGLPGETLRCRITERKPRFAKAEVLETITPSPDAVPSFCAFSAQCGGCAWTTLDYTAQLAWKERQVKETLRRIGKVDFGQTEYLPITPAPRPTRYRNKVEFAFGFDGELPSLGLRRRNSHAVVSIDDCALCALPANAILTLTRQWMAQNALLPFDDKRGYLRFLVVRCPEYTPDGTPRCLVECITAPGSREQVQAVAALGRLLMEQVMGGTAVTGFLHSVRTARTNVAYGEKVITAMGETTVTEAFGHCRVEAPAQAFLQANTGAAALLYERIREYAEEETFSTVWDIYCGVGSIGLFLAREGLTLRGIENVAEAVRFAQKNAVSAPGDCAFTLGDAGLKSGRLSPSPDLIITDPPRAGMPPELRETLLKLRAPRIIAVSCDAASLARDIAALNAKYKVKSVRSVDLFPHTPHIEIVALLSLAI